MRSRALRNALVFGHALCVAAAVAPVRVELSVGAGAAPWPVPLDREPSPPPAFPPALVELPDRWGAVSRAERSAWRERDRRRARRPGR